MKDVDGVEWVTIEEAVARIPRLRAATVRKWVSRGRVRRHLVGGRAWVSWDDVLDAELAARRSGWRTGHRGGALSH